MMGIGLKWCLYVLYEFVYGECGVGVVIVFFLILIFDVELLEII